MYKVGSKIYCWRSLIDDEYDHFKEGKYYFVDTYDNEEDFFILHSEQTKFCHISMEHMGRYFYTEKELRRAKLLKCIK